MRMFYALLLCVPLLAQDPRFFVDLHLTNLNMDGHFNGIMSDQPITLDLTNDFALGRDSSKLGGIVEYQGPRFGVELSTEGEEFKGQSRLVRDITIDGKTFNAGMDTTSQLKLQTSALNWTIRVLKFPAAVPFWVGPSWVGVDLGLRLWDVDISASGYDPMTEVRASASVKTPIPIPQLGLSAGLQAFNGQVMVKGHYHYLAYHSANYHHALLDLRYFPLKNVGARFFLESESFNVPKGAVKDDLEISLGRSGVGYGVIVRF